MSLIPKIVRGSAMLVLEQAVRLCCALWITPRMVYYLGEAGFGLWGLLSGIFSQFVLLDLGLCTSMPRFLSRAIGRGDEEDVRLTTSTGTLSMLVIGLLAQIAGTITWFSLPHFLSDIHELEEARAVVVALMVTALALWISRPILLHLQSRLRRDIISGAGIIRVLICTPLVAWALSEGKGLVWVAWIHCLGTLGEGLLYALLDRSYFSLIGWHWVRWSKAKELLQFARWSYLLTTAERVRSGFSGSDLFILAAILGTAASGVYALGQRLAYMFYEIAYSIVGAQLLSAFSHMDGAGDEKGLERGFIAASRISSLVAIVGGGMLWTIGPAFLARWVPGQAKAATPVLLALIFPHVLCAAQIPSRHLLISLAKHRALALAYLAGIIVNILLTVILVKTSGMIGAAQATLVEMTFLYAVAMPWLIVAQSGLTWKLVLWDGLWRPLLHGAALLCPAFILGRLWLQEPLYSHIAIVIAALSILFFLAVSFGLLGRDEKMWLKIGWKVLFTRLSSTPKPTSES
ncbi:MAG: oligosaccharide flippase family protein [Prosthecobacter sp.]|nr:oligosaccharide flippase family protein [Prosthecobacter sp.]